jgi:hypothetical protein
MRATTRDDEAVTEHARGHGVRIPRPDRAYRRRALLQAIAAGLFSAALCLSMLELFVSRH